MKKITLIVAAFGLSILSLNAQDELVNKNGLKILPETGDYAIGVDFAPFIKTLNFNASNTAPAFKLGDGLSIFGKYFAEPKMAYRVKFALNHNSTTVGNYVTDQTVLIPEESDVVEDKAYSGYTQFALAVGFEKRRGHNRLQGYYGADVFVQYLDGDLNHANVSYEYGNGFSSTYTAPITTDFNDPNFASAPDPNRLSELNQGANYIFGARAFVGAEYFLFPKLSIGGELGWGLGYGFQVDGSMTTEEWDLVNLEVKKTTVKKAGGSQFLIGSDASGQGFFESNGWLGLGGNINLIFHF